MLWHLCVACLSNHLRSSRLLFDIWAKQLECMDRLSIFELPEVAGILLRSFGSSRIAVRQVSRSLYGVLLCRRRRGCIQTLQTTAGALHVASASWTLALFCEASFGRKDSLSIAAGLLLDHGPSPERQSSLLRSRANRYVAWLHKLTASASLISFEQCGPAAEVVRHACCRA